MPLYEYRCEECEKVFDAIVSVSERDETTCPECGEPAERQLSGFSIAGPLAGGGKRCYTGG